jgi:hemerythrin superfamily protein
VNHVLQQLLAALDQRDLQTSRFKLDLLWARLAVHIRAEHLHLFPVVINQLTQSAIAEELTEAQSVVAELREDHDFFMRELAQAVGVLRNLPDQITALEDEARLASVHKTILEIEKRLATHNTIEENQIYLWAGSILSEAEQSDLAAKINAELQHRPSRFSVQAWENNL